MDLSNIPVSLRNYNGLNSIVTIFVMTRIRNFTLDEFRMY